MGRKNYKIFSRFCFFACCTHIHTIYKYIYMYIDIFGFTSISLLFSILNNTHFTQKKLDAKEFFNLNGFFIFILHCFLSAKFLYYSVRIEINFFFAKKLFKTFVGWESSLWQTIFKWFSNNVISVLYNWIFISLLYCSNLNFKFFLLYFENRNFSQSFLSEIYGGFCSFLDADWIQFLFDLIGVVWRLSEAFFQTNLLRFLSIFLKRSTVS